MRKTPLFFFLVAFTFFSCKKEKPAVTPVPAKDTVVTQQSPAPQQVAITGLSPASGTAGTVVTVSGTNFGTAASVYFNGVVATVQSVTATEIKVIAPQSSSGIVTLIANVQTVTGPAFNYAVPTITGISPATGSSGAVVTLSGTNFGTVAAGVKILFNGVAGNIQSITNTEIKVIVPVTTSGNVTLALGNQNVPGPAFTYTSILTAPYTSGDVVLKTQAEVDGFVNQNVGRQLTITGNLYIFGADISSVSGLANITSVSGAISITDCPLLTDVSFLSGITSAGSITFRDLAVSAISMDKLTGVLKSVFISSCKNLNSVNLKSVNGVAGLITGNSLAGGITINTCPLLAQLDYSALSSVAGSLFISGTVIPNLSGFSSLQKVGALTLSGNSSLINLRGLEQLTTLTLPAGITGALSNNTIYGMYITGNPKLTSLTGLQNLKTVPVARIITNVSLNDFCPAKSLIILLSTATPPPIAMLRALTLTANGNYATTADALAAVALCN